jgi:hypothetical protein
MRFFVLAAIILLAAPALAHWDECPFGLVNDPHPGQCAGYVDADGDGICDRSQPHPDDRNKTEGEVITGNLMEGGGTSMLVSRYDAIPLSIIMIASFMLTELLVKSGRVSVMAAKYFWNVILAIAFFISLTAALPSIIPALKTGIPHLKLHVKSGIIMAQITLYHIWKRRHFYTRCMPKTIR